MQEKVASLLQDADEEILKKAINLSSNCVFDDICKEIKLESIKTMLEDFKKTIEKDLNIPNALPYLHILIKEKNADINDIILAIGMMDFVLGLNILKEAIAIQSIKNSTNKTDAKEIEKKIEERNLAKKEKNYKKADEIREMLKNEGIMLEDTPNGTVWRKL